MRFSAFFLGLGALCACALASGQAQAAKGITAYDAMVLLKDFDAVINRQETSSDRRFFLDHFHYEAAFTLRRSQPVGHDLSNPYYVQAYHDNFDDGLGRFYTQPYAYMGSTSVQESRQDRLTREGYMQVLKHKKQTISGYFQTSAFEGIELEKGGRTALVQFSVKDYGRYASAYNGHDVTTILHEQSQCQMRLMRQKSRLIVTGMACDVMPIL